MLDYLIFFLGVYSTVCRSIYLTRISDIREAADLTQIDNIRIIGEVTSQPGVFIRNFMDNGFYIQNYGGGIYVNVDNSSMVENINQGDLVLVTANIAKLARLGHLEIIPTEIKLLIANRNNIYPLVVDNFIDYTENDLGILYELEVKVNVISPIPTGTGTRVDITDSNGNFIRLFYTNFTDSDVMPFEVNKTYRVTGIKRYFIDICLIISTDIPFQNAQLSPRGPSDVTEISNFSDTGYNNIHLLQNNGYPFLDTLNDINKIRTSPDLTLLTDNMIVTGEIISQPGIIDIPSGPGFVALPGFFIQNKNGGIYIQITREQLFNDTAADVQLGDIVRVTGFEATLNVRGFLQINAQSVLKLLSNVNKIQPIIAYNPDEYFAGDLGKLYTINIKVTSIILGNSVSLIEATDCEDNFYSILYTYEDPSNISQPFVTNTSYQVTGMKTFFANLCLTGGTGGAVQVPRLRTRTPSDIVQINDFCP